MCNLCITLWCHRGRHQVTKYVKYVCPWVCQPLVRPRDNSPPVEAKNTKIGTKMRHIFIQMPIDSRIDRPCVCGSELAWKSNFIIFWVTLVSRPDINLCFANQIKDKAPLWFNPILSEPAFEMGHSPPSIFILCGILIEAAKGISGLTSLLLQSNHMFSHLSVKLSSG